MNHDIVLELERLAPIYKAGTSKLLSVDGFDIRAGSLPTSEFIDRLKALFGPPDADGSYVFRHRSTGLVISVYSAQTGPAFGGGPCYPDALPPESDLQGKAAFAAMFERQQAAMARVSADPVLGALQELPPAERMQAMSADKTLIARQLELAAPHGFVDLARRLNDALCREPCA